MEVQDVGAALGSALGGILLVLVTGKTLRYILYRLLSRASKVTETTEDDKVVEVIRQDLGVEAPKDGGDV